MSYKTFSGFSEEDFLSFEEKLTDGTLHLEQIGGGENGEVYRFDFNVNTYALKVFTTLQNRDGYILEDLHKDGEHPNYPKLYGYREDETGGNLYMITEFVEGKTLEELKKDGHPFQTDWLYELRDAAYHAFDNGFSPNDIAQLDNVMIDNKTGNLKVVDTGFFASKEHSFGYHWEQIGSSRSSIPSRVVEAKKEYEKGLVVNKELEESNELDFTQVKASSWQEL